MIADPAAVKENGNNDHYLNYPYDKSDNDNNDYDNDDDAYKNDKGKGKRRAQKSRKRKRRSEGTMGWSGALADTLNELTEEM